jgi:CHAT domain-containing protein
VVPIGKESRIYIVPDGEVVRLSFVTLPDARGKPLVENAATIAYLAAERDLCVIDSPRTRVAGVLAFGDPDFEENPVDTSLATQDHYRGPSSGCEDFQALRFVPLPQGRREVREVVDAATSAASPPPARVGSLAREAEYKRLASGQQFLHIATHGSYLPRRCTVQGGPRESPLVRSGLAFAGANERERWVDRPEDGILTAEEVSTLDLTSAVCVVLSACETGVGDVVDGEGVIGLRRAFQIAGARSLVTTLWKVGDATTRAWMREFYRGVFERREDPARAAHVASKTMYHWEKDAGRQDAVSTWGAFVVSGAAPR